MNTQNLIVFSSSNPAVVGYYNETVQGRDMAVWGMSENNRALFDKVQIGDAVIFPDRGTIKFAGIVCHAFEDTEGLVLVPEQGNGLKTHLAGHWHNKLWGEVDANGTYGKFIIMIKSVPVPDVSDYREYISVKDGKAWDTAGHGYPHRKDTVFPYKQAWGLIDKIV